MSSGSGQKNWREEERVEERVIKSEVKICTNTCMHALIRRNASPSSIIQKHIYILSNTYHCIRHGIVCILCYCTAYILAFEQQCAISICLDLFEMLLNFLMHLIEVDFYSWCSLEVFASLEMAVIKTTIAQKKQTNSNDFIFSYILRN